MSHACGRECGCAGVGAERALATRVEHSRRVSLQGIQISCLDTFVVSALRLLGVARFRAISMPCHVCTIEVAHTPLLVYVRFPHRPGDTHESKANETK